MNTGQTDPLPLIQISTNTEWFANTKFELGFESKGLFMAASTGLFCLGRSTCSPFADLPGADEPEGRTLGKALGVVDIPIPRPALYIRGNWIFGSGSV
jgi:hypothetical protein